MLNTSEKDRLANEIANSWRIAAGDAVSAVIDEAIMRRFDTVTTLSTLGLVLGAAKAATLIASKEVKLLQLAVSAVGVATGLTETEPSSNWDIKKIRMFGLKVINETELVLRRRYAAAAHDLDFVNDFSDVRTLREALLKQQFDPWFLHAAQGVTSLDKTKVTIRLIDEIKLALLTEKRGAFSKVSSKFGASLFNDMNARVLKRARMLLVQTGGGSIRMITMKVFNSYESLYVTPDKSLKMNHYSDGAWSFESASHAWRSRILHVTAGRDLGVMWDGNAGFELERLTGESKSAILRSRTG